MTTATVPTPPAVPVDQYLNCAQAAAITPGRPRRETIWAWMTKGIPTPSRNRIRLQHVRMGKKLFTTSAWLTEFGTALAQAHSSGRRSPVRAPAPRQAGSKRREKQIAEAQRELLLSK